MALHDPGSQPGSNLAAKGWKGVQFLQQYGLVDAVEALSNIRIQRILGLLLDARKNSLDGIVAGASRSKAITVGFKSRFPFGFKGEFDQCL